MSSHSALEADSSIVLESRTRCITTVVCVQLPSCRSAPAAVLQHKFDNAF